MKKISSPYYGYRHPGEIISHAVWLYHRFTLSFRNVEEILVSRGVDVTYESVRLWCLQFGAEYAKRIKSRAGRPGDTWHLDEVFIRIKGKQYYLWRAVDQDGDVLGRCQLKLSDKSFDQPIWLEAIDCRSPEQLLEAEIK